MVALEPHCTRRRGGRCRDGTQPRCREDRRSTCRDHRADRGAPNPSAALPSHLLQVHADLVSRLPVDRGVPPMPHLETSAQYSEYIRERTAAWQEARQR